ncbi:phage tail tip lysozyme [Actinoplanes oblitus]|uniref:Phage tail tip lysozyme n=1 Tax=Actinoplanes oblitus TaxID=3040509 RepID=A0ABY8WRQ7_9ACTN|nr:phage tail tip lysozyme [Actinoplanes oblitus]WIM99676.1 phage tail tip lysozyme [Actinoplanes oblitus]
MATDGDFDQKADRMRVAGIDPGPATGVVETVGAGQLRRHRFALLTAHPERGMHEVHGRLREYYESQGGPAGAWGFPITDEYPDGADGRSSDFEGGTLAWTPAGDVLEIPAPAPGAAVPAAGDWPAVPLTERLRYATGQLVHQYGFPADGAAGVVGNLLAESGVIPSRIEGSTADHPMRARNFDGVVVDFTPEEIMLRARPHGPRLPGAGLAQWTAASRRSGLFTHVYQGRALGAQALLSMDAQLHYLVEEMRTGYRAVFAVVTAPAVTVDEASDEIVYGFEVPGAILDASGHRLPRTDPAVQSVFAVRRAFAHQARATLP